MEDDWSNVWGTSTAATTGSSSAEASGSFAPPAYSAMPGSQPMKTSTLTIAISSPEKHGEGFESFTSYMITTKTNLPNYAAPEVSVRRRYQDFLWLRSELQEENPSVLVPPLPEKHVLGYLDRFSSQFIEKRQEALQRFLDRVASHPTLYSNDTLRTFLEAKTWGLETAKQMKKPKSGFLNEITGTLANAFSKIKHPDTRFVAIFDYVTALETYLSEIEKLHQRIHKRQTDMVDEIVEFGSAFTLLSSSEVSMEQALRALGVTIDKTSGSLKTLNDALDNGFMERVRDYLLYCQAIKAVLAARDERQVLHEELQEELDLLMGAQPAESSIGSNTKAWLSTVQNSDPEKTKLKVAETEANLNASREASKQFSEIVLNEISLFNDWKTKDMIVIFKDYAVAQKTYYESNLALWEQLMTEIDAPKQ